MAAARGKDAFVAASFLASRMKNMYDAGLDYQLYFALEDFYNTKENVIRNVGIFWFDPDFAKYRGGAKSIYNVFRMFANLGSKMYFSAKLEDEFVGVIATKTQDGIAIILYNYIDPETALSFLSKNIGRLNEKERKLVLSLVKRGTLNKIMRGEIKIADLRATKKLKALLQKAQELTDTAEKFKSAGRAIKINYKNLQGNYLYQRYVVDASCSADCEFSPVEAKPISASGLYQDNLQLKPYSVNLIVLKKSPDVELKANIDKPVEKPTDAQEQGK